MSTDDDDMLPLPARGRVCMVSPDLAVIEIPETAPEIPECLTDAEADVARAVVAGKSNGEIAAERSVSHKTVNNQLASIYAKLGIRSRVELVVRLTSWAG